jgi:transcriptional regulator with GAF, ATPase, and Fis domain
VARLTVIRDVSDHKRLQAVLGTGREGTLVTQDLQTLDIISRLEQIGPTNATVLIQGESGTGKTQIARLLHRYSQRADGPLVEINCAAIPETLIESELFGHVKGAFTGAQEDRKGRFQTANGGTLLLDEVGELPLHLQAKLLRVLQDHRFEKVGSDKSIEVDVRVIAASNRNLREAVDLGQFRADLYYRLAVIPISVPPLRDRPGDIPLLAEHFRKRLEGKGYPEHVRFTPPALQRMMDYAWPGNVRELANAVEHGIICAVDGSVLPGSLPQDIRNAEGGAKTESHAPSNATLEKAIRAALAASGGNRAEAARRLGIDRTTLWRRMSRLGIRTDD